MAMCIAGTRSVCLAFCVLCFPQEAVIALVYRKERYSNHSIFAAFLCNPLSMIRSLASPTALRDRGARLRMSAVVLKDHVDVAVGRVPPQGSDTCQDDGVHTSTSCIHCHCGLVVAVDHDSLS